MKDLNLENHEYLSDGVCKIPKKVLIEKKEEIEQITEILEEHNVRENFHSQMVYSILELGLRRHIGILQNH